MARLKGFLFAYIVMSAMFVISCGSSNKDFDGSFDYWKLTKEHGSVWSGQETITVDSEGTIEYELKYSPQQEDEKWTSTVSPCFLGSLIEEIEKADLFSQSDIHGVECMDGGVYEISISTDSKKENGFKIDGCDYDLPGHLEDVIEELDYLVQYGVPIILEPID